MSKIIKDLECSIIWMGEPTFDACYKSIERQTYVPDYIHIIKDISPLNEAINERHRRMGGVFSVKVDADFILYPECFETLYKAMQKKGERYYAVSGLVNDTFMGPIGGVHLERSALVKPIKVPNVIGCDRYIQKVMLKKGYAFYEISKVLGEHVVDWSLENVFSRYFRVGQKHSHFGTKRHNDYIKSIGRKWMEGDRKAFIALMGYCHGLFIHDSEEKGKGFAKEKIQQVKRLIKEGVIPKP